MKKAEIRQRDILKHLQEYGSYSYEDIMSTYNISLRSMKGDIAALNAQGFVVVGVASKKAYELVGGSQEEDVFYDAADRKKIRKLIISLIVSSSKNGISFNHEGILYIRDRIGSPNDPLDILQEDFEKKDITKTIEGTIEEMLTDGELLNINGILRPVSSALIQLPLSREDAINLLNLIKSLSKGNQHKEILDIIGNKLSLALYGEKLQSSDLEGSFIYSGNTQYDCTYEKAIKMLSDVAYENNAITVRYFNRKGREIETTVLAGLVVYSPDKRKTYLLGESNERCLIINLANVIEVTKTDIPNSIFRSDKYLEMADAMFEISIDDPVHVKIRFDDIPSIRHKLYRLKSNRKCAVIYKQGNSLIYEDMMSGLNDFAHYLRRFGYGVEVIEPVFLRQQMKESCESLLKMYREKY